MTFSLNQILAMAGRTVQNPKEGASELLSLGIPREALWLSVAIVVVLSIFFAEVSSMIAGLQGPDGEPVFYLSPVLGGILQLSVLVGMGGAVYVVGRAMGGSGSFPEAMLLMAWLQFIMILVQVVQIAVLIVLPGLSGIVLLLGIGLFLWLLTNFVAELHGFASLGQVFVMILVTSFAIAFFLSLALTFLGVAIPIETGGV